MVTTSAQPTTANALQFAVLDGLRIAYRDAQSAICNPQSEIKEPLLLIHGLGAMIYSWSEVFADFAARRRTVALDLKGHGASDKPPHAEYSFDAQAEVVAGLMERLDIERAAVVGHSMGGAVALRLAARYPQRVSRLVLADALAYRMHTRSLAAQLALGWTGRAGHALACAAFNLGMRTRLIFNHRMRAVYRRRAAITPERAATYYEMLRDPVQQRAVIDVLQAWNPAAVERCLSAVRQPTLIVWGDDDRIIRPSFAHRLVNDLPDAQLRLLPCGHVPQEELPQEFARLVNEFCS